MSKTAAVLSFALATTAGYATYDRVTSRDVARTVSTWHPVAVTRSGGFAEITSARPDAAGGRGALELTLLESFGTRGFGELEVFSRDTVRSADGGLKPRRGGFGRLADLEELSFEWFRDGRSSAPGLFTPALRVFVWDPDAGPGGATTSFIWEGFYNGYASGNPPSVAVDRWVHANVTRDFFWRVPLFVGGVPVAPGFCAAHPTECFVFNRALSDWALGPDTVVIGLSISVGSGWTGSYKAYADLVRLEFAGGKAHTWDFEPCRGRACRPERNRDDDDDDDD